MASADLNPDNVRGLSIVNPQRRVLPGPSLLHDLVAKPTNDTLMLDFLQPDDTRVKISYHRFQLLTDLLARRIQSRIAQLPARQVIVPAIIPQCPELYIAWVGVLKAGAGYCPVNPDIPDERLKFIVKDVEAPFVLTTSVSHRQAQSVLVGVDCITVSLQSLEQELLVATDDRLQDASFLDIDPKGPAYVMYTSGSTGLPKGVKVSHFSATQSLLAHQEHIPNFKRFLQFAAPTFDVSIFEIFFPFYRGATLVGCDRERMLADLPGTITALDIDAAELTPTVAGTLLCTREAAPCLKTLLTIGEMLTPQVVTEFGGTDDRQSMLFAMYGPTEAAIHCTIAPRLPASASVRSIGIPFSTVTAFVLKEDSLLEIAPIGQVGELSIAGQLADGYLNRPDQSAAAFVYLPGHGNVYKTGDRAICHPDGRLEILGRISAGQVKIRGQRVELGEIEQVAAKVPNLAVAVASVIDDVLVLFCAGNQALAHDDVAATCKSWLPPFMRPGEIFHVEQVPRLPSGKIDRKSLESTYRQSRNLSIEDDHFEDELERNIASILRDELGTRPQRLTPLWSSGLDSLRAIKVASKLRQKYPNVSAAMVLEAENIPELAILIRNTDGLEKKSDKNKEALNAEWAAIEQELQNHSHLRKTGQPYDRLLPCSPMQIAMLVETCADERLNFNDILVKLDTTVSFQDFEEAFQLLAHHNEILRSGFIATGREAIPFAQVVWQDLGASELSLLHPIKLSNKGGDKGEVLVHIHHAIYDGWSWDLILDDLNSILSGKACPERIQYTDFYDSQLRQTSLHAQEHIEYWRQTFNSFVPTPFPNLSSNEAAAPARRTLKTTLSISPSRLYEASRSLRCSRATILEASWLFLLSTYLDSQDVSIGTVLAGRHITLPGVETIIGPCLATLPVRADLDALRTAHDVLDHIQRQHMACLKHGNLSLHDVMRAIGNTERVRLFDSLCVWQEDGFAKTRDRSKVITLDTCDALDYAAVLEFEPREDSILLRLTFDTGLISNRQANILASQLDRISNNILDHPEAGLQSLCKGLNTESLSLSNVSYRSFTKDFDLASTISHLAKESPNKIAVEFVQDFDISREPVISTLTYKQLYADASAVASALKVEYNVVRDDLVCVLASKSLDLYVGILGVVLAGAGYLCIDVRTPAERTRQILHESKASIILTNGQDNRVLHGTEERQFLPISDLVKQSDYSKWSRPHSHSLDSLAYAVFTSGSTGIPKGVLITRKNLLSNIEELSHIYPTDPSVDKLLQACSPAFDVSVFEIFWTWHMGMTLCSSSNDILFRDVEQFINAMNITHLSLTPSVAALVNRDSVPGVKMLVTAGEPMNSKVFDDWKGRGLFQGYGPSETTNICNVRPRVSKLDDLHNVGPTFANTSVFICRRRKSNNGTDQESILNAPSDDSFQILPKGAVGEVWIGGEQVGKGYIDASLTEKSFFNHPDYGRLYRSGDIGRLLADESLVILGREDDQVKLRGQRIELGEINSSVLKCHGVKDAVSMIVKDTTDHDRLITFWSPVHTKNEESLALTTREYYDKLHSLLPTYMIPDTLVHVSKMPLTGQGKIDRRSMLAIYRNLTTSQLQASSRNSDDTRNSEPLSEQEHGIAWALSEVLGVSVTDIGRNSSFYGLGLDSISAIRLSRLMKSRGHSSMEVSIILQNPSIGKLMSAIRTLDANHESHHNTHSKALSGSWQTKLKDHYGGEGYQIDRFLPCTPLQESMISSSINSPNKAYSNKLVFKVSGQLSALRDAWSTAMQRHQLLRTGFASIPSADNPYVQVVLEQYHLPWQEGDSENSTETSLDHLMLPPWNLQVIVEGGENYLILHIHHALYDAEAMSLLLNEIESSYFGCELAEPVPFDRYLDYMVEQEGEHTNTFWKSQLHDVLPSRLAEVLPNDARSQQPTTAARYSSVGLSTLKTRVKKLSTTTIAVLQATWCRLLSKLLKSQDVCFGNVLSGRNLPVDGVERMIAPCFNTLPTRVYVKQNSSIEDLCHTIQRTNLSILPFQSSSLRQIQRQNVHDGRGLFDTLVLLQNKQLKLDERIWMLNQESGDMSFPFILEVVLDAEADTVQLQLHSEVANQVFLEKLLLCFDLLLDHSISFPQARAADYYTVADVLPSVADVVPPKGLTNSRHPAGPISPTDLSIAERKIVEIITSLKPEARTGISKHTTIFHLGLDSINAVQIASQLRKHGYKVTSASILEAASIEKIALLCSKDATYSDLPGFDFEAFEKVQKTLICHENNIDLNRVQTVRPCTATQSGILYEWLRSNGRLYVNSTRFSLGRQINIPQLCRSWDAAISRHEMLRTGFVELEDSAYPFAMITYRSGATELPWIEQEKSHNENMMVQKQFSALGDPPWQLRLSSENGAQILELRMLHALYDANSMNIILNDVASIYRDNHIPPPLPLSPTISKLLTMGRDENSRHFWSSIAPEICPTVFPDMRIFNDEERLPGVVERWGSNPRSRVERICANGGANLQALFVAAWSMILSAYTAQPHVTVGIVLAGRDLGDEETTNVAFPCINTAPFPVEIGDDHAALLERCSKRNAKITRYQQTPLNLIKQWTGIEESFFDTIIAFQKYDASSEVNGVWSRLDEHATAEYAVSLEIFAEDDDRLRFQLTHRTNVLPTRQASIVLQEFDAAINKIMSTIDSNELDIPDELLSIVPCKDVKITTNVSYLHEFVELSAREIPDKTALEFVTASSNGQVSKLTWSYKELDCSGNKIANLITSYGPKPGGLVAVCFDKCPEASFAILGVLKAGFGYLAIDPTAPEARKLFILKDSGCQLVLTTQDKLGDFCDAERVTTVVVSEDLLQDLSEEKASVAPVTPEDTCYCLYTSGTTGTPKGCLISHDSAVQAMLSFQRIFHGRWNSSSRWLQFASFHFDVSVLEQYWSWSVGICVTSVPRDLLFEDFSGTINTLKITHLDLTPSLARLLTPQEVPHLSRGVFIVGGEQVRQDILDTWGDVGCLYNFYGPSEVTIGCTVHRNVSKLAKPTNIGQQWDNVGSFVLEPGTQIPVLRGAVGELCLSGPLVGKGYLNREDLTREKFATLHKYGVRVYRTGDLVRLLEDQSFEFLGRMDDQVKLRGQRLEIGEINHVVMGSESSLQDATTMVLKHPVQHKDQLVTFFSTSNRRSKDDKARLIPTSEVETVVEKIKRHCSARLPSYMVPTHYFAVSSIPLTVNNKVDHKALRELFAHSFNISEASQNAPRIPKEEVAGLHEVIRVISSFLRISPTAIQPSSRLFELGLDSVSAIALSRSLRKNGFKNAEVGTILKNSVVTELAFALRQDDQLKPKQTYQEAQKAILAFADAHHDSVARHLGLDKNSTLYFAPCTPIQEGMISKTMQKEVDDKAYLSAFYYQLAENIDISVLRDAWVATQRTTPILRTLFVSTVDGNAQVALRTCSTPPVNVRTLQNGEKNSSIPWTRYFNDWMTSVRSFGKELPWRVELVTLGKRKYMSLFMFHGLYDGISLQLLLKKIEDVYLGMDAGSETERGFFEALPYGPLTVHPEEESFWKDKIPEVRRLGLPKKQQNEDISSPKSSLLRKVLNSKKLSNLCTRLNVTAPAVFQAAWLYVLAKAYGVNPTIGVVVSGRAISLDGADNIIGPMFNTIPFSIQYLPEGASFADLVRACHQYNVEVIPFQHTALRRIARYIGHDMAEPVFEALFVFNKAQQQDKEVTLWKEIHTEGSSGYPLNIEVEQKDHDIFLVTLATRSDCVIDGDPQSLFDAYCNHMMTLEDLELPLADAFCRATNLQNTRHDSQLTRADLNGVNNDSDLTWQELKIRTQLANLASVPEWKIHRNQPTIFELGLDSIEAMKLAARLKDIAPNIAVSMIMRSPTLGGIAKEIDRGLQNGQRTIDVSSQRIADEQECWRDLLERQGIEVGEVQRVLPVTPMQEGLLMDPQNYFNILVYKLRSGLDIEKLKDLWDCVIRKEPVLRTRFASIDTNGESNTFLQYVSRNFNGVELSRQQSLTSVTRNLMDDAKLSGLEKQTFQIRLVDNGKEDRYLVLGAPHALYDAWSLNLLHQEVGKQLSLTETDAMSIDSVPYEDHLQEISYQARSSDARSFWSQMVKEIQPSVCISHLGDGNTSEQPILVQRRAAINLDKASKFCRHHGVTLQCLALLCWTTTLANITKSLDVCFGMVLSGRTTSSSEQLVFPTFNTVLFRNRLDRSASKIQALESVQNTYLGIAENQHYPLRETLRLARAHSGTSNLFDTLFTFQKLPSPDKSEPCATLYDECHEGPMEIKPPYPVNVEFESHGVDLKWTIALQGGVAHQGLAEDLIHQLNHVLVSVVEAPEAALVQSLDDLVSICGFPNIELRTSCQSLINGSQRYLNEPDGSTRETNHWTALETDLRTVLANVSRLSEDEISKKASIFHLGLDSVSAIKVSNLFKKKGIRLPVSDIIKAQTIEAMAQMISQSNNKDTSVRNAIHPEEKLLAPVLDHLDIDSTDVEAILPATAGQRYMLAMWKASRGRLFYPTFWLHMSGTTRSRIHDAFSTIIAQLPMFRTRFALHQNVHDTSMWQIVLKASSINKYDLPWSLKIEDGPKEQLIALKIHHALYDAVSLQLIISELKRLCQSGHDRVQLNSNIKHLNVEFQRYSGQAEKFWSAYLAESGTVFPVLDTGTFAVQRVERYNPKVLLLSKISTILRKNGITIQALLFAVYAKIYSRLKQTRSQDQRSPTHKTDVVIGIYLANRSLDIDGLVDCVTPTFNIVPLRIHIEGRSLFESAAMIQQDLADITKFENCCTSLHDIHAWTGVKIDTYVNFLSLPGSENEDDGAVDGAWQNGIKEDEDREEVTIMHAELEDKEKLRLETPNPTSPFFDAKTSELCEVEWCMVRSLPTLLYGDANINISSHPSTSKLKLRMAIWGLESLRLRTCFRRRRLTV